MQLYKTLFTNPFGVVVRPTESGLDVTVNYEDAEGLEEGLNLKATEPFHLSKDTITDWIGERGLVECGHVYVIISRDGQIVDVRNKTVDTIADKKTGSAYLMNRYAKDEYCLCQIYIPLPDSPFSEWTVRFNANPDYNTEFPEGTKEIAGDNQTLHDMIYDIYPQPVVEEITDNGDGSHTFTLSATLGGEPLIKEGLRFFINADNGYVNKREVRCGLDGKAYFKARRLDLDPSDKMVVEIGFKFVKNLTNAEVPL